MSTLTIQALHSCSVCPPELVCLGCEKEVYLNSLFVFFLFTVRRLPLHQRRVGPWGSSVLPGCIPCLPREMFRTPREPPPRTARHSSSSSRRAYGRRACTSARRPSWRASGAASPRRQDARSRATRKPSGKRVSVTVGPSLGGHFLRWVVTLLIRQSFPFYGQIF